MRVDLDFEASGGIEGGGAAAVTSADAATAAAAVAVTAESENESGKEESGDESEDGDSSDKDEDEDDGTSTYDGSDVWCSVGHAEAPQLNAIAHNHRDGQRKMRILGPWHQHTPSRTRVVHLRSGSKHKKGSGGP